MKIELKDKPYINPETGELQPYRFVIQCKHTGQTLYDEIADELLKFYTKKDAEQFIYKQAYVKSDFKILKVGANKSADLKTIERIRRQK